MTATELKITEDQFSKLESVYSETFSQYNDNWKAEYHTLKKLEGVISQAKMHTYCVAMNKARKEALKNAPRVYAEVIKDWMAVLLDRTSELKKTYLEWTEKWAGEEVQRNIARKARYSEKYRGLNMDGIRAMTEMEKKAYYREQRFVWDSSPYIFDVAEFTKRALYDAVKHYESNIELLAYRLVNKNMAPVDTVISHSSIGVNIDLWMTNNSDSVHAWTIVASGPIQRPHYRYLVK